MRQFLLLIYILAGIGMLFSQPIVSDFRVNGDSPQPITIQSSPRFFADGSNGFVATWTDYRSGAAEKYAQKFDKLGNKTGVNYRVYDDYNYNSVSVTGNLFLSGTSHSLFPLGYYRFQLTGKIYNGVNPRPETIPLGSCLIPQCGTGWNPYSNKILTKDGKFYVIFSSDERVEMRVFDTLGNVLLQKQLPVTDVRDFWATVMPGGEIVMMYRKGSAAAADRNKMWGLFFDKYDSLALQPADPVFTPFGNADYLFTRSSLRPISDTTFQLLWINASGNKLCADVFSVSGVWFTSLRQEISLPGYNFPYNTDIGYYGFYTTNTCNEKYDAYIGMYYSTSQPYREHYINALFPFNKNGTYAGSPYIDTNTAGTFYNLYKSESGRYFSVTTDNKDIYLTKLNYLVPAEQIKINDDTQGSNEEQPELCRVDDQRVFITYSNEAGIKGRLVSKSGEVLSDEKEVSDQKVMFFASGGAVSLWRGYDSWDSIMTGISYLDVNLNEIRRDTFKVNGRAVRVFPYYTTLYVPDTNRIIFIAKAANVYIMRLMARNGSILKELTFTDVTASKLTIFSHDENSFYLHGGWMQLYDKAMQPLSQKSHNIDIHTYLGGNRYLTIFQTTEFDLRVSALIGSVQGDTIKKSFYITDYIPDELKVIPIDETYFVVLTRWQGKYYTQTFRNDGMLATPRVEVLDFTGREARGMAAIRMGDRLLFARSDNKAGNLDIWAAIFNTSRITAIDDSKEVKVKIDYRLAQNYPNPFNPATVISFSLPVKQYVSLKVYDVLGKEIAVLVNEERQAGTYSATFKAEHLSSGIYFYALRAGTYIETRKMILLK